MRLSHVVPYAAVAVCAALRGRVPAFAPWADLAALAIGGAWLAAGLRARAYPELRSSPESRPVLAAAAGLAVGLLWMPLASVVPTLSGRAGFDADAEGGSLGPLLLAARISASVLLVPVAEELFVRSFLPRWVDSPDGWRAAAPGAASAFAWAVSVAFFAATHPEWLAALAAGLLWTALLRRTRSVRDAVLSHAVANAWLAGWVLVTGDRSWW